MVIFVDECWYSNYSVHLEHTGMAGKTLDLNEVASAADDRIHREPPC
jgi:hypothetical protein